MNKFLVILLISVFMIGELFSQPTDSINNSLIIKYLQADKNIQKKIFAAEADL